MGEALECDVITLHHHVVLGLVVNGGSFWGGGGGVEWVSLGGGGVNLEG